MSAHVNSWPISPENEQFEQLANWWIDQAEAEIGRTIPKAIHYGSSDLVEIGRQLAPAGLSDAEYAERGVAFYACGKMARITSAIRDGRAPTEDSWFDLGVYARIALRIRQVGAWPGVDLHTSDPGDPDD